MLLVWHQPNKTVADTLIDATHQRLQEVVEVLRGRPSLTLGRHV
jgi:hypothetical protein